jgi:hypothetical protein
MDEMRGGFDVYMYVRHDDDDDDDEDDEEGQDGSRRQMSVADTWPWRFHLALNITPRFPPLLQHRRVEIELNHPVESPSMTC